MTNKAFQMKLVHWLHGHESCLTLFSPVRGWCQGEGDGLLHDAPRIRHASGVELVDDPCCSIEDLSTNKEAHSKFSMRL